MALFRAAAARSLTLALLAIAGSLSSLAQGGETWDGNGGDNDWTTNNNWNPNGDPPNDGTADIVMAGTNRLTPRVDVDWDIFSLVFNNTAGGFSISGDPGVTLGIAGGGITNQDTQLQILLLPIQMNSSQTWNASAGPLAIGNTITGHPFIALPLTLSGANNIQISGAIVSGVAVNKAGSGTLTFNGLTTNTYTGATTVNAGTLVLDRSGSNRAIPGNLVIGDGFGSDVVRLDAENQISEAVGNTVTVNSSGVLNLNGFNETIQNLAFNGGSISNINTLIVNGAIASGATTAGLSITGGTLDFGGGNRTITVADGAAAVDLHIAATRDNGALTKAGPGVLRLSGGADFFYTATTVNEGTLELNGVGGGFQLPPIKGNLIIGDGVGLDTVRVIRNEQFSAGADVTVKTAGLLDLNGWDEYISLVKLEGGSVTTGPPSGLLLCEEMHVFPSAQTATFTGRLQIGGVNDRLIVDDGPPVVDLMFDGEMIDFEKHGDGLMRVSGIKTSLGFEAIDVRDGTLVLARTQAGVGVDVIAVSESSVVLGADEQISIRDFASATVDVGATLDLAGFSETMNDLIIVRNGTVITNGGTLVARNLTLQEGGSLNPSSGLITINGTVKVPDRFLNTDPPTALIAGNVALAADKIFDVEDVNTGTELEVSLALQGASLTKIGVGTMLLSGAAANAYSGATTVSKGVLVLNKSAVDGAIPAGLVVTGATVRSLADEQIATAGVVALNAGGVLDLNGFTETIGSLALNGGALTVGAGTLILNGSITQGATAASNIGGRLDLGGVTRTVTSEDVPVPAVDLDITAEVINGGIVKQGAGALRLGGSNTFAGGVNLQTGKLLIAHDNALGTGALSLEGGAVEADGGARSISNPVVVASLSTVSGSNPLTFGGSFTTNLGGALFKNGAGALTIAGPQTHAAGATLFATAGTVNFDSSATGATLGVNLSNAGTVVNFNADQDLNTLVVNGGRARVGDAAQLRASGLSIGANAVLELEIGGLIAGDEFAQLLVSGNAALAGALQIALTNSFSPTAGNSFDILDWGSLSGSFATLNLPALAGGLAWNASQLYTTGVLSVAPAFTADFDSDGDVDGADLAQWQGDFGATPDSDADDDGDSDGDDFLEWQRQVGSPPSVAASASVPEPAAAALLALAVVLFCVVTLRR